MMLRKSELPSVYKRCEYLESTGTQWIDTGYRPYLSKISVRFEFSESKSGWESVFITNELDYSFSVFKVNADNNLVIQWGKETLWTGKINIKEPYTLEIDIINKYYVNTNGEIVNHNFNQYKVSENSMLLFHNKISELKIYEMKISENNELVHNFIPALDPSGRPCMYDTVTQQPFYNQGTGEFLYELSGGVLSKLIRRLRRLGGGSL